MSTFEAGYNVNMALLLVLGLMAVAIAAVFAISLATEPDRRFRLRRWRKGRDIRDPAQQLHAVMGAGFEKRRLMNGPEFRLFCLLEEEVRTARGGHRVFAQTNLGEILASRNHDAFASINSKRVDLLIVDAGGWPVAAIEYQGKGHYAGTAAARDAVKKEALRKAGVRYIEVCAGDRPEQVRARLREQMGWKGSRETPSDRGSGPPVAIGNRV